MFELALAEEAPRPVGAIMEAAGEDAWRTIPAENLLLIETPEGRITIYLSEALAQDHVAQARTLAKEGFYEGLSFYRVIDGFVAQGGDHAETRELGSAKSPLKAEFEEAMPRNMLVTKFPYSDGFAPVVGYSDGLPVGIDGKTKTAWHLHCTGAFAYARNNEKDTASTEFYITLQPQRYLDRNLTVLGRVIDGMSVAQAAPRGVVDGDPETDDFSERLRIDAMHIAADLPEDERPSWQHMRTNGELFAELTAARAARPSEFFYFRPDYIDICSMTVPVRPAP
ncbi:peptidylprolyl isomerase [Parvularcula sp. ZS-1/3]|uniref:peptidylprolyl isomerase n=1 Tax=Parvularcula mediterranea TaxID=2732508 RepID=A0A7Y3RNQ2_9PROT|nr:peptidylprolyl isomerase [Parvularcula mediterranea]NNU17449.1 peptidylprolyl isomerase [Parvularcula mediterranea]